MIEYCSVIQRFIYLLSLMHSGMSYRGYFRHTILYFSISNNSNNNNNWTLGQHSICSQGLNVSLFDCASVLV